MRNPGSVVVLVALLALAADSASAAPRVLTQTVPAADVERVSIDARVGDVSVQAGDADSVTVEVTLEPRRGGLFASIRQAEREVQEAHLVADVAKGVLKLSVESSSEEHRFEEKWTVTMPARLALGLKAGVGDVEVRGLAGGIELQAGVGDVLIEATGGDLTIKAGVGDLTLKAPADAYGSVTCTSGVGETSLKVRGSRVAGNGFVGSSSSWSGEGPDTIRVELGVGDATVTLE